MNRPADEIYDTIIKTMQDKALTERQGCFNNLLKIYQRKIKDVEREQELAICQVELYYMSINQIVQKMSKNRTKMLTILECPEIKSLRF